MTEAESHFKCQKSTNDINLISHEGTILFEIKQGFGHFSYALWEGREDIPGQVPTLPENASWQYYVYRSFQEQ